MDEDLKALEADLAKGAYSETGKALDCFAQVLGHLEAGRLVLMDPNGNVTVGTRDYIVRHLTKEEE